MMKIQNFMLLISYMFYKIQGRLSISPCKGIKTIYYTSCCLLYNSLYVVKCLVKLKNSVFLTK